MDSVMDDIAALLVLKGRISLMQGVSALTTISFFLNSERSKLNFLAFGESLYLGPPLFVELPGIVLANVVRPWENGV